jgi:hypothetical protein
MGLTRRALLGAALACHAGPALTHSYRKADIAIGHAWGLPSDGQETRVMVPLLNSGGRADRLVAAVSPVATRVVIMRGEAVQDGIDLPAGRPVPMRPDALHLRLTGLSRALRHGDRVPMTLTFALAGTVEIEVWIEPRPYAGPPPA